MTIKYAYSLYVYKVAIKEICLAWMVLWLSETNNLKQNNIHWIT